MSQLCNFLITFSINFWSVNFLKKIFTTLITTRLGNCFRALIIATVDTFSKGKQIPSAWQILYHIFYVYQTKEANACFSKNKLIKILKNSFYIYHILYTPYVIENLSICFFERNLVNTNISEAFSQSLSIVDKTKFFTE